MLKADCFYGYSLPYLQRVLGIPTYKDLVEWMRGQTMLVCTGQVYDHDTKSYRPSPCGGAHGVVVYPWDFERWQEGLPVVD